MVKEMTDKLYRYADAYRKPPFGREVIGTVELLEEAASCLAKISAEKAKMTQRYEIGMLVKRQGADECDGIECPVCGYEVARNDDFYEMRPKHCPECGTKLLY